MLIVTKIPAILAFTIAASGFNERDIKIPIPQNFN